MPLPSVKNYKRALNEISQDITPKQMKLLRSLFEAEPHLRTASQLARDVGYQNFRGTNLQIGLLGTHLREALNYYEKGQQSYILCERIPTNDDVEDWILLLHKEVAQALKELGWFATQSHN